MIPLIALLAVTIFETPGGDEARFAACTALIKADPKAALDQAQDWATRSADVPARQCLGLAFVAAERWEPAALTFEAAAKNAEIQRDGRAATLWTQAANASLAGDDPEKARDAIDRALALPTLADPMRGEAWIDRARADVALNDLPTGRYDLDHALQLVPQDPFAWLLSATLARRQKDLARAEKDIAEAVRLAADDPSVALEQGNIAFAGGKPDTARDAWTRAAQLGPDTPEGRAAKEALGGEPAGK